MKNPLFLDNSNETSHNTSTTDTGSPPKKTTLRRAAFGILIAGYSIAASAASFTGLGFQPSGTRSYAVDVSGDGTTIVGNGPSANSSSAEAFAWTETGGFVGLGFPGSATSSRALAVNADGSVIVGGSSVGQYGGPAFRWTAATGPVELGSLSGVGGHPTAYGVSDDGNVIVGQNVYNSILGGRYDAFYWTIEAGIQSLGFLPGAASNGLFAGAFDVSGDGTIVVGYSQSTNGTRAFIWDNQNDMRDLNDLVSSGDAIIATNARAISQNGRFVVGSGSSANGSEAFLFDADQGRILALGDLATGEPNDIFFSYATDVSADGAIVTGTSATPFGAPRDKAFIWDPVNGIRNLKEVLEASGLDLTGWTLKSAEAVSDDGRIVTGYGINPSGVYEAWIAELDPIDTDGDGVLDDVDNCPADPNPDQADNDGDSIGDVCDSDDDNDGFEDTLDNCPLTSNPDQSDLDGDGQGDLCDDDIDGDNVANDMDLCAGTAVDAVVNARGCSIAQLCPCDGPKDGSAPWKKHKKYVACVKKRAKMFKKRGLITKKEKKAIIKEAKKSKCGRKRPGS